MIKVNNVTYNLDSHLILDSVSAEFNVGEVTCILGVSGCGKTTFIKLISGILEPTFGDIEYSFLDDHLLKAKNNKILYPQLTTVFQNYKLLPHLTVEQNLSLVLKCNNYSLQNSEYNFLMDKLQLRHLKNSRVYTISSGERQRIALIRALLLNPTYLLLDEATSALDIESASLINSFLLEYKDKGKAIIFVSHSINICKSIADKVIFMDAGKIIENGSLDILSSPQSDRLKKFISHS